MEKQLMNKRLKKVVSRRRGINKSTSKINQELISLVTKLVLFRATIWPLKISFPGCALKQENWVKTKRKEGRGGRRGSMELRRTLSFIAQPPPTIFIKFLFNVSTGKLKMYVNKWDKRVWNVEMRMAVVTARI